MDTDQSADQTSKPDPQKCCSHPKEVTLKYDAEPIVKLSEAINNQTSSQQSANVDSGNVGERQIQQQGRANDIADRSMYVNGCLTLITAGVFVCTVVSLWFTRKDVAAAQAQFEISNRPFVEMGDFKVDSIQPGQKPIIRFNFYNSGKFPAKIIYYSYLLGAGDGSLAKEQLVKIYDTSQSKKIDSPNIILSSLPVLAPYSISVVSPLSKVESDAIKNGTGIFYISIELKYLNFLTNEHYLKKEMFQIKPAPIFSYSVLAETDSSFK